MFRETKAIFVVEDCHCLRMSDRISVASMMALNPTDQNIPMHCAYRLQDCNSRFKKSSSSQNIGYLDTYPSILLVFDRESGSQISGRFILISRVPFPDCWSRQVQGGPRGNKPDQTSTARSHAIHEPGPTSEPHRTTMQPAIDKVGVASQWHGQIPSNDTPCRSPRHGAFGNSECR